MSYSKTYDPEKYSPIASIIEKTQLLEQGEAFKVTGLKPSQSEDIRYLLYDWFRHMNLKGQFRVEVSSTYLRVYRKGLPSTFTIVNEFNVLKPELEEILKESINLDKMEASLHFANVCKEGRISKEEQNELERRWLKIMS